MTDLGLLVIFYKTIGNYKQELDKNKKITTELLPRYFDL